MFFCLQLLDLDLADTKEDYVSVKDGEGPGDSELTRYTGQGEGPAIIMSTGNHMYIYLHTDRYQDHRGVQFSYVAGRT